MYEQKISDDTVDFESRGFERFDHGVRVTRKLLALDLLAARKEVDRLSLSRWAHKAKAKKWWRRFRQRGRTIGQMQSDRAGRKIK